MENVLASKAAPATASCLLILASSSPRRQELIRSLQLPYAVRVSDVDETVPNEWMPDRIVEQLSIRKAAEVARRQLLSLSEQEPDRDGIVIGSDTIVVLDGQVLGKPEDEKDAVRMLTLLQGRTHEVYSGIACIRTPLSQGLSDEQAKVLQKVQEGAAAAAPNGYRRLTGKETDLPEVMVGHTVSRVTFKAMTAAEIEGYVQTGEPLDKAGSYGVQGLGSVFVERIEGDFYSIMGLPLHLLYRMLLASGVSPFQE